MSRPRRAVLQDLVPPIALAVASAAFTLWQNLHVVPLVDVAYIVNIATRIAAGEVPYSDFPLAQAPLSFLVQALLIKLFGPAYPVQIAYATILGGVATAVSYAIVRRLLRGVVAAPRSMAAAITVPLVPLGIYSVLPHPFYDSDACLVVLVALAAVLIARERPARAPWLLAGALLTIPLFVKQNIGGAFLVVTIAALAAEALARPGARAGFRWCALGAGLALAAAALVVQLTAGLGDYLRWTLGFALAGRGVAAERLSAFADPRIIWPGVLILALVAGSAWLPPRARVVTLGVGLLMPVVAASAQPALLLAAPMYFPPLLIAAMALAFVHAIRKGIDLETLLPFVLFATTAGTLMSQGLVASTFGIFPLLVLAIASLVREIARALPRPAQLPVVSGLILSAMLAVSGSAYVLSNTRLQFVDVNAAGPVIRSTFPSLAGLSARGPYIADLDAMLFWARENVPPDEPMVFLPGEDPAFFALARPPRMPSVYFFDVANPYSPAELARFADEIGLRWVFVKDRLQLREEPPLNQAIVAALTERATLVARVSAYRIYRR